MKWSVERSVVAGFGLALLILVTVGVVAYQAALRQTIDARRTPGSAVAEENPLHAVRDATPSGAQAMVRSVGVPVVLVGLAVNWRGLRDRRRAKAAQERVLLQVLMDYIPDTIYFKDTASRFTRINRAQAKVLGVPEPTAALGKTDFDFLAEDVSRQSFAREQEIMASGQPLIDWIEFVPTPEGAPRWFSSTKVPIRNSAGQVTGLVGISRDVTEHQQTQAALEARVRERTLSLRMLSECNQALVRATDEASLLNDICRLIVEIGGHRLAWVGLAEPDEAKTVRPVAQAGDDESFLQTLQMTWADDPGRGSPSGMAIRTGQVVVTHDILGDARFAYWQARARRRGYVSAICLPLSLGAGVLGVLSLYSTTPQAFTRPEEVELLVELSRDVAYGLTALATRNTLRRTDTLLGETNRMAQIGAWELDLLTRRLHWSDEMYRIHEVDPAAQPSLAEAINFYAPEARPALAAAVERATADGMPWDMEVALITASGRRCWVRTQGQVELRDGRAVRMWGAVQDITERKQAETRLHEHTVQAEALARISKDLAEVSTNYGEALDAVARLLAERVGDGCALYLVSDDSQWMQAAAVHHRDRGAAEALQVLKAVSPSRADEGLGGRVLQTGQSLLMPQVDMARLRANFPPEYSDYLAHYSICSLLCVALRAEGRPLGTLVLSRATPDQPYTPDDQAFLEEVAGRAALVIINARHYADLERRVAERTQSLEAANQELEAFSYSVSHDLRAPLRAIDGFSQILLEDYASQVDAAGQDYLKRVRGASQKMGELIDALLGLARVSRGELRRETVDLAALAREALGDLQARDPARQVEIVLAEGLKAQGDPRLLRAALGNLLENAWKFTAKTPGARIELGCLAPGASAPAAPNALGPGTVFFVRDNGAGFDMAHADRLFGAFQRLHAQAEFGGTGIGLATVQRIMRRHGGQVWAEGEPGKGATFFFTLAA